MYPENKPVAEKRPPSTKVISTTQIVINWFKETTMHGPLHICKDVSPFLLQRIIWAIITVVALVLLLYQVSTRLILYYAFPIAVDIKLNYRQEAKFPAVTICNTNRYRTTAISSTGFYDFWLEYWDPAFQFDFEVYKNEFDDLDVIEKVKFWAHQKEDLIHGCRWHGGHNNCGPENFTTVFTDYGVCYTFNSDAFNPAISTLTGSGYGLKLVINVEQYEYSRGPENTAGVKILVHPPGESPRMKDLGVYVPVGFEALVGVQHNYRINLPAPYGKCKELELKYYKKYTPTACNLDCIIDFVVKECGCRDTYMPELYPGYPPACELKEWVQCAMNAQQNYYNSKQECDCPEACITDQYSDSISYALISKLNAESIASEDLVKAAKVKKQFENARNVYSRQNKNQRDHDRKVFLELLKEMLLMEAELQKVIFGIQLIEKEAADTVKKVFDVCDIYEKALSNFTLYYNEKVLIEIVDTEMFIVETSFTAFNAYMLSAFVINFNMFFENVQKTLVEEDNYKRRLYRSMATTTQNNLQVDLAEINGLFDESTHALDLLKESVFIGIPRDFPMIKNLEGYTDLSDRLIVDFQETFDCIKAVKATLANFIDRLNENDQFSDAKLDPRLKDEFLKLKNSGTEKALHCSHTLHNLKSQLATNFIPKLISENKLSPFKKEVDALSVAKASLMAPFQVQEELTKVYTNALTVHENMRTWFESFFMWRGSKLELATNMSSFQVKHFEQEIQLIRNTFAEAMDDLAHSDEDFLSEVSRIFESMSTDTFVKGYFELDMEIKFDFQSLEQIKRLVENEMHLIKNRANIWLNEMTSLLELTSNSFQSVAKDLTQFKEETQTDTQFHLDNFLQLNVYFTDFREERIIQRAGYDFNSFIGDMGGSLGLFMGSSILTLFELLDFIIENLFKRVFRPDLLMIRTNHVTPPTSGKKRIQPLEVETGTAVTAWHE